MRKVFTFISKETSGLHEAAYLLAGFSVLSQILGLLRDRMLSGTFGATDTLDIYYAAFKIPDLLFIGVASMVSVWVLIPFFSDNKDELEQKKRRDSICSAFSFTIIIVSLIAYLLMPILLPLIFPGLPKSHSSELLSLSRIMLLSPIFLGLSNLFGSLVQMRGRFFLYALSPVLYNIGIIAGIVVLYPTFGVTGLAWGVALGALLHFVIQLPFLIENNILPRITFNVDFGLIKNVVRVSIPRTIALSINSITGIVLASFASLVGEGSIAVYALAFNLQSVPLSIIGASYSSAAFPALSRLFAKGDIEGFIKEVVTVSKHVIFWGISGSVLFILLSEEIVRTILGTGSFGLADVARASVALSLFAVSIVPQSLTTVFMRVFYAKGETARPLGLNVLSAVATVLVAYICLNYTSLSGVTALAFAYSIGAFINMFLHIYSLRRDNKMFTNGFLKITYQTLFAWLLGGTAIYFARTYVGIFDQATTLSVFLQGLLLGIISSLIAGITLYMLKNDELLHILSAIKRRFGTNSITE